MAETSTGERADLLESLRTHRDFLRYTVRGLAPDQLAQRTTVSELTLGGVLKHVALTERRWANFIVEGPGALGGFDEAAMSEHHRQFQVDPDDSVERLLAAYQEVADRTDQLVTELPDLDAAHMLPRAPWFPPDASWSARRVLLHILAETAQHAGHADIIREALDGQKTMG